MMRGADVQGGLSRDSGVQPVFPGWGVGVGGWGMGGPSGLAAALIHLALPAKGSGEEQLGGR